MNYVLIVLLIAVGVYDIYLAIKKHPTLSQQYQKLFPTWLDLIMLNVLLFILLTHFMWIDWRLKVVMSMTLGHICWSNSERYNEGDLFNYFKSVISKWLQR